MFYIVSGTGNILLFRGDADLWKEKISGSTFGPPMLHMRKLYLTKIEPIITYGCAAWYLRKKNESVNWGIRKKLVEDLERLQYKCLARIAGAFQKTSKEYLTKELNILPIDIRLRSYVWAFRARQLQPAAHQHLFIPPQVLKRKQHPYDILEIEARHAQKEAYRFLKDTIEIAERRSQPSTKSWANLWDRSLLICEQCNRMGHNEAKSDWRKWSTAKRQRHHRNEPVDPALRGTWGRHNLSYHNNLSRAQSTILIQCRTGFIGLKAYLAQTKVHPYLFLKKISSNSSFRA